MCVLLLLFRWLWANRKKKKTGVPVELGSVLAANVQHELFLRVIYLCEFFWVFSFSLVEHLCVWCAVKRPSLTSLVKRKRENSIQ